MGTLVKKQPFLTRHLGFRVSETVFSEIQQRAAAAGRSANDWCRDRLVSTLKGLPPSTSDQALLAEIVATQDIVVDLFCALGHDGKLTSQKAQEIVDAAHERKYRDVPALFKYAHSRSELKRTNR